MKVGRLEARVRLDRNPALYTGPKDPVSGRIVLTFRPFHEKTGPMTEELFGPLRLRVVFQGDLRTSTKDFITAPGNTQSRGASTENRILFRKTCDLFDGPFRAKSDEIKEFPFIWYFPEHATPAPERRA